MWREKAIKTSWSSSDDDATTAALCFEERSGGRVHIANWKENSAICMHSMKLLSPFFHTIPLRFSAVLVIEAIKVEFSFLFFSSLHIWMTVMMMLLLACTHFIILSLCFVYTNLVLQPYYHHTTKLQWTYSLNFAILKEYIYIRLKMKLEHQLQGGNKTKPAENSTEELISSSRKSFRKIRVCYMAMAVWNGITKKAYILFFSASPA